MDGMDFFLGYGDGHMDYFTRLISEKAALQTELAEIQCFLKIELLEHTVLQRFKTVTLEEIRKMIELTPLENTVAGKELIQQGMERGQLIGQIQLIQRILKRRRTPKESLAILAVEELETMLAKLEAELSR